MIDLSEDAKQAYKAAIVKYLQERCKTDRYLAEACKKEGKTLDGVVKYIVDEARKRREGDVAFISDAEVYEMAAHYILEDSLDCEKKKPVKSAENVPTDINAASEEDDEVEISDADGCDDGSSGHEANPAPKAKTKTIAEEAQLNFDF